MSYRLNEMNSKSMNTLFERRIVVTELMIESSSGFMTASSSAFNDVYIHFAVWID